MSETISETVSITFGGPFNPYPGTGSGGGSGTGTYADASLSSAAMVLTAGTAFGNLTLTATGVTATTIHWVANIQTAEAV